MGDVIVVIIVVEGGALEMLHLLMVALKVDCAVQTINCISLTRKAQLTISKKDPL